MESIEELLKNNPKKLVGLRRVLRGLNEDTLWCVIMSSNCDERIKREVLALTRIKKVKVVSGITMEQLGSLCGIDVKASTVGLIRD